jgi:hypothetical protein
MKRRRYAFTSATPAAIVRLYGSLNRIGMRNGIRWQVIRFHAVLDAKSTYRGHFDLERPSLRLPVWLGVSNETVYGRCDLPRLIRELRARPATITDDCAGHPDVRPWFHEDAEPGPYTEDPEDGYAYDE